MQISFQKSQEVFWLKILNFAHIWKVCKEDAAASQKVLIRLQTCCLDTRYLGSVKLMSRFLSNKVDTRCCCLYCRLKSFLRSAIKHAFSISRNVTELFWLFIFWNDKKHGLLSLSQTTWPFLFRKCRYFPEMFV